MCTVNQEIDLVAVVAVVVEIVLVVYVAKYLHKSQGRSQYALDALTSYVVKALRIADELDVNVAKAAHEGLSRNDCISWLTKHRSVSVLSDQLRSETSAWGLSRHATQKCEDARAAWTLCKDAFTWDAFPPPAPGLMFRLPTSQFSKVGQSFKKFRQLLGEYRREIVK